MNQTQYDCVICLTSFDKKEDIKQLCENSQNHIMCNDCYLDIVSNCIIKKRNIRCPFCIKIDNLRLFNFYTVAKNCFILLLILFFSLLSSRLMGVILAFNKAIIAYK